MAWFVTVVARAGYEEELKTTLPDKDKVVFSVETEVEARREAVEEFETQVPHIFTVLPGSVFVHPIYSEAEDDKGEQVIIGWEVEADEVPLD